MHKLEKHIANFLLPFSHQRIAVACSGGVDSMVLLNGLIKAQITPIVLHVNYHLRGIESDLDEEFIRNYCLKNNLEFYKMDFDLKSYLEVSSGNLQQEARKIRYNYFESFNNGNTKVLFAHHADDQVETFFLNLARGGGMMGLSCMLDIKGIYMRPLLTFYKTELLTYAKDKGLIWREDASNNKLDYSRNKLRNVFIPQMVEANPNLKPQVLFLISQFQKTQLSLEKTIESLYENLVRTNFLEFHNFDLLDDEQLITLLRLFDLKSTFVKRLIELRKAPNGKFLDLSKSSFTFSNKNSFEKIYRENNGFRFIKKTDQNSQNCKLNIEKNASLPQVFDKNFIYLNPKKLNGELKLRNWQKGDRIKPIGVNGSKLVSDVLKDAKVPLAVRSNQLIVHDANKVLWVVGHCVSREGIADSNQPIWKVSVDTKLDSLTLLL